MTSQHKRKLIAIIKRNSAEYLSDSALEWMFREGIIDIRAVERMAIRYMVEQLVRSGERKMRAIDEVADQLNISFEKAREAVYRRIKQV